MRLCAFLFYEYWGLAANGPFACYAHSASTRSRAQTSAWAWQAKPWAAPQVFSAFRGNVVLLSCQECTCAELSQTYLQQGADVPAWASQAKPLALSCPRGTACNPRAGTPIYLSVLVSLGMGVAAAGQSFSQVCPTGAAWLTAKIWPLCLSCWGLRVCSSWSSWTQPEPCAQCQQYPHNAGAPARAGVLVAGAGAVSSSTSSRVLK